MRCKECERLFIEIPDRENHLAKVYSDEYFFAGKDGYPNYLNERDLLYDQGLRYARLIGKYTEPGKVLDVGSAAGFILKGFERSGWTCRGIEPNETMAAYGRNILDLDIETASLETFETDERFDLVSLIQVIGHVYDLDQSLRNVNNLLKQNGLVLVESWNMNSFVARIMGEKWHEYSPPSVVHWYSDKTLTSVFRNYGFEIIAKGYPLKKISAAHALSFLEGKSSNVILKRLANSLIRLNKRFTFIYPLFDAKWYIFRKI